MFSGFTIPLIRQKQAFSYTKRTVKYGNLQYLLRVGTFISFELFTAACMKDAVWHKRQDKWRHPRDWQAGLGWPSGQTVFLFCVHNRFVAASHLQKGCRRIFTRRSRRPRFTVLVSISFWCPFYKGSLFSSAPLYAQLWRQFLASPRNVKLLSCNFTVYAGLLTSIGFSVCFLSLCQCWRNNF